MSTSESAWLFHDCTEMVEDLARDTRLRVIFEHEDAQAVVEPRLMDVGDGLQVLRRDCSSQRENKQKKSARARHQVPPEKIAKVEDGTPRERRRQPVGLVDCDRRIGIESSLATMSRQGRSARTSVERHRSSLG